MIQIYHNPRCRKSREGLAFLEASGKDFEVINYLDQPLSVEKIKELLSKLNMPPINLVRKNEVIWKSDFKGKDLSNQEIIQALTTYPQLLQRPIVVHLQKAVVAQPATLINNIL